MHRNVEITNTKADQVRFFGEIARKVGTCVQERGTVGTPRNAGRDELSRDRPLGAAESRRNCVE